jgi:hypothetical protein
VDESAWVYVLLGLALFLGLSVGGLLVVGFLLVKLPADYFCDSSPREFWIDRHPVIRRTGLVAKNALGALLAALGVILSLPGVPGPGILTILIGVILLDFPGKRRLERWLIGVPTTFRTINRLRRRYGRPPLVPPATRQ